MSSSASDPERSAGVPRPDAASEPSAERADPALLDKVLKQTLDAQSSGDPSANDRMRALVDVARRHRGKPLTLEPVAVELVEAVLAEEFPQPHTPPKLRQAMSARIAQTLLDDPVSRERLAVFWARLSEDRP